MVHLLARRIRRLERRHPTTKANNMADFIEGKRPVIEALRTEVSCKRVLLADNVKRDPLIEDVLRKAKKRNVPVETGPRGRLEKLSERGSHQGGMAETKPFNYVNVTTIVETATAQAAENGGSALVVILDSNITTLIAAAILFYFGSGPIRGFAVTLSIGIVASVFCNVVVTRTLLGIALSARRKQTI